MAALKTIDARTSAILSLSEEHKFELQRTRSVLIRAILDATEVKTPTAFVILTEKLATKEELENEREEIALKLRDDGTGIDAEGTLVNKVKDNYKRTMCHLDVAGSTFFGHYVCYVRDHGERWWLLDDEHLLLSTQAIV